MSNSSEQEKEVEQLQVLPLPAPDPAIGRALWQLEAARGRLLEALNSLDDNQEQLEWEPYDGGNSVGTLLYHIAAIEVDWLYTEVLEKDFSPEVVDLFPYPVRDENGRLFPVTAVSLHTHLHRLAATRQQLLATYAQMSLADFRRARQMPRYHVTPEWVLFHLTQHETEHRGQIQEILTWSRHHGRENPQPPE